MKTIIVVLLFAASSAWATCNQECYEYNGVCACDIKPYGDSSVHASDEKPPEDKMPSYQREGIKVLELPSLGGEDIKADQAMAEADEIGKKAAGIQ